MSAFFGRTPTSFKNGNTPNSTTQLEAFDGTATEGASAVALGRDASASGDRSVALGFDSSTAVGAESAVAIGDASSATGAGSIALGPTVVATGGELALGGSSIRVNSVAAIPGPFADNAAAGVAGLVAGQLYYTAADPRTIAIVF